MSKRPDTRTVAARRSALALGRAYKHLHMAINELETASKHAAPLDGSPEYLLRSRVGTALIQVEDRREGNLLGQVRALRDGRAALAGFSFD